MSNNNLKEWRVESILRKIKRASPERSSWDALTRAWYDRAALLGAALESLRRQEKTMLEAGQKIADDNGRMRGIAIERNTLRRVLSGILAVAEAPGFATASGEPRAALDVIADIARKCLGETVPLSGGEAPDAYIAWGVDVDSDSEHPRYYIVIQSDDGPQSDEKYVDNRETAEQMAVEWARATGLEAWFCDEFGAVSESTNTS